MRCSRKKKLVESVTSFFMIGILGFSCSTSKNIQAENYSIEFFKAQNKYRAYLTLKPRDGSGNDLGVFTYVNGLLFENDSSGKIEDSLVLEVKPDMNIRIEVYSLGYKSIIIKKLKLQKGDSVTLDLRMRVFDHPLYESNSGQ